MGIYSLLSPVKINFCHRKFRSPPYKILLANREEALKISVLTSSRAKENGEFYEFANSILQGYELIAISYLLSKSKSSSLFQVIDRDTQ